jgi:hypothetical protein
MAIDNSIQKKIPTEWQEIKLADIFEFKNGLNKEKKYFAQELRHRLQT